MSPFLDFFFFMLFGSFRAPRSLLVWNIDSQSNLTNRFLSFLNVKPPMTKMSRGQRTVSHFSYIISFISIDLSYHFLWSNLVESRMSLPNIPFFLFFNLMFLPRLHVSPSLSYSPSLTIFFFFFTIDTHTFSFLSFFSPFFSVRAFIASFVKSFFSLFFLFLIFSDHYCPYNFFFSAPFLFFLF